MKDDFPESIFSPPPVRPPDWPDEPNLRKAVDWLKSFIPPGEWKARRQAAAKRLYSTALGQLPADDKGRYFSEDDTFGWYLFLAEAFLDHIWNYDPMFGSRVVPVIMSIGRSLDLMTEVDGLDDRVRKLVGPERRQPNGGIFELLVAAAYRRAGADVKFVAEKPGRSKTYDIDVAVDGRMLAVECKRMEVGEYSERERARMRELWKASAQTLAANRRSTFGDVTFSVPLETVPNDYLTQKTMIWLKSNDVGYAWDDAISSGSILIPDLTPLATVLSKDDVLMSSSRLHQLITGHYERNANYIQILSAKRSANPRYLDECDMAVLLRWASKSPQSVDAKARDIGRRLAEANRQLPTDKAGIVHIGFEAVEGDAVERARYAKILASTAKFDPGAVPLEYVFCHYLVPESPPDQAFAYDETTQWCAVRPTGPPPLRGAYLVVPHREETVSREGTHWQV